MGKKRTRITNPEPFAAASVNDASDDYQPSVASTKSRSKPSKKHQLENKVIPKGMSSKILKEAMLQQKEIEEEETDELNAENNNNIKTSDWNSVTESVAKEIVDEDGDIDDFQGFSETQSHYGGVVEEELDEEQERLWDSFLPFENPKQRTLADTIIAKIKDEQVSSEVRPVPKLDTNIIELYKGVGKLLNKYTSGKMPKAFKHIPSLNMWEEVLYLTEPEKWSPNAMYQATRLFASNLGVKRAERFYKLVILPRVREDILKNKRLHFSLYQSLKKCIYKPAAFNKGILFPLCESRTCSLREAVIVGSVLEKVSIPPLHSSVALLKLAEMDYCGTTSYFIKILVEKKYALPYRVLDAMVDHFMRFYDDSRIMPVIWHQSLLAFAQRYKNELTKEDKVNLNDLVGRQRHKLVTPEILRELNNSRNRGEKEDVMISAPASVIYKTIEEDRFDFPEVPMEED